MAGGGGGGGDVVPVSPRAQQPRGGRAQEAVSGLPLDVVVEIAARSDAATLVRCAATCRDARRRIAEDPNLRGRLRLRDTGRFLLPLLRGHLTGIKTNDAYRNQKPDVYLVDTTAADATPLVRATFVSSSAFGEDPVPVDSRGGLVLVSATATTTTQTNPYQRELFVCNPATRRRLFLPPEPAFDAARSTDVQYVLLVGEGAATAADAAVGRPFQVLKAKLVLSEKHRCDRRLLVQTFSSEHGAWSPCTEIPTPNLRGSDIWPSPLQRRPLVVGDVVHWLCLTDVGSYVLMLHVRAARLNETALPASFPRDDGNNNSPYDERRRYLMATASAGGNPVVLVADTDRISAWEWEQSSKHTKMWKPRPQVVIENEAILRFNDETTELVKKMWTKHVPELVWFGERSGAVLLRIYRCCLLWLDLHSKKIVRFTSSDRPLSYSKVYCPYEVDSSSWVPTFSRAGAF